MSAHLGNTVPWQKLLAKRREELRLKLKAKTPLHQMLAAEVDLLVEMLDVVVPRENDAKDKKAELIREAESG